MKNRKNSEKPDEVGVKIGETVIIITSAASTLGFFAIFGLWLSRLIMRYRSSDSENSMEEFESFQINQNSSNKSDGDQAAERESGPRYAADPLAENQSSSDESDSDQVPERESGSRNAANPLAQNQGRFI